MQSVLKINWINQGTQMASAGADGLVKIWNLVKSENIATYNEHDEGKVWALSYSEAEKRLFTGGSDSKVLSWDDITDEVEKAEFDKRKSQIAEDQKLTILSHEGKMKDAAVLAFKLGKTKEFVAYIEQLLIVAKADSEKAADPVADILNDQEEFSAIFEKGEMHEQTIYNEESAANKELQEIVAEVAAENLGQLFNLIKDCNTNSHHALLAQSLLFYLIQGTDIEVLKENAKKRVERVKRYGRRNNGRREKDLKLSLPEIIDVLVAYTERHAGRVDKFIKFSCFIDYLAQKMDIVMDK